MPSIEILSAPNPSDLAIAPEPALVPPGTIRPQAATRLRMGGMRRRPRLWDYCYFTARTNLAVLERTVAEAGPRPRVVDIGCGNKPFAALFPEGTHYLGIDFDQRTAADLVHDLGRPLPLEDGCADLVILSETIEHVPDPELVFAEATRILARGGLLFVSAPFAFPIHGRPWDYRRLTDYFYRAVPDRHLLELIELQPSNNVCSTPLLLGNQILLSAPGLPWTAKRLGWLGVNLGALLLETLARPWRNSPGRLGLFLRANPSGYAMRFRRRES